MKMKYYNAENTYEIETCFQQQNGLENIKLDEMICDCEEKVRESIFFGIT